MPQGQFVKIQCKADSAYNLAARTDGVVMAPADESDPRQQWYKDESWEHVKDAKGSASFALINRATGQALTHPGGLDTQVTMSDYFGDSEDKSTLWTLSQDVCGGWNALRPYYDTSLNLSTNHWDKKHGGLTDGTDVLITKWKEYDNQCWKLVPTRDSTGGADHFHRVLRTESRVVDRSLHHLPKYSLVTKAGEGYSVSARGDGVVLAPSNPSDGRQQWIKDDWWGSKLKDSLGQPAFVMLNVATQHALSHAPGEGQQVSLAKFVPNLLNQDILWTKQEVGHGWFAVRPANNVKVTMDAFRADKKHGGPSDGTKVVVFKWSDQENQHWKFTE
ncbi:hypothetical protein SELMODRAFT_270227 [Selaginella moellendorffii]|uniref:Ricin B lectin domain-containing protein n=1 Tax=Selaginella moellendorffii TaxID=88036 RepID=D8QNI6_SELML|nr:ricin B-like lectin R40C1 [Selaginella moellendorffii]EFJ38108.1 hypothetical protein SELMODRAFT_270227 [Selaginella moellendorffii]|eukprot:XP_002960569.1 ricin B-like lectin R40C1 [Selaginella moellendorffii]